MKNFVQYHNASKQGSISSWVDEKFQIFSKKGISGLMGNRVWLISGTGISSPKQYQLEYFFTVSKILKGEPSIAAGTVGQRFNPAISLNDEPWFKEFLESQQRFSLGVREIPEKFLAELESLVARSAT